jgi:hypothetical protein
MVRRPSRTAAVVAGVVGLVVLSAGGGAVANTLITGAQIKDGTVTGADLRNGTVRSVDVGDGSLTGTDIANGSVRTADVAGGYYSRQASDERFLQSANPPSAHQPEDLGSFGTLSLTARVPIASTTFTAPTDGVAVVTAVATFKARAADTYIESDLQLDGVGFTPVWYWDPGDLDDWYDQTQSYTEVVPVSAGDHTITLVSREQENAGPASEYDNAKVTVVFLPEATFPATLGPLSEGGERGARQ